MSSIVDLLLITHNRRQYVEKTVPTLLADPGDFRLHCWDNASTDGTADLISSIKDPRVVTKHFSKENLNQREPCLWLFEQAQSDLIGKVDDDILLPAGWVDKLAGTVRSDERFGMLGCWIFMPEDWDEKRAHHNIVEIADHRVFRTTSIAGHSFLARKKCLLRYIQPPRYHGIPINRTRMSADGLISGYPLPLLFAHNMDDPRSPHNQFTRFGDSFQKQSALTARMIGIQSPDEYANWIAADAVRRQEVPFEEQLQQELCSMREQTLLGRARHKLRKLFG
jgi:glycosyltransferase involved in cell wall biosynthesis